MSDKANPLNNLLIDEGEIEKMADQILSTVLTPYIRIVKGSQEIQLTQKAHALTGYQKVLLTLASRLALQRLKIAKDPGLNQKEIIDLLRDEGVAEGTVKSALNRLRKDKMMTQAGSSRYRIGIDKLPKLQGAFGGKSNE